MSEDKAPTLEDLKLIHDIYAVTHQVLTQKATFHHEEFEFIGKMVEFYKQQIATLRTQIEELEEKAKEEEQDGKNPSEG